MVFQEELVFQLDLEEEQVFEEYWYYQDNRYHAPIASQISFVPDETQKAKVKLYWENHHSRYHHLQDFHFADFDQMDFEET